MSALPEFTPEPSPEGGEGELTARVGEDVYLFTWHNTLVRRFRVGDGEYDHVLHIMPTDEILYIFGFQPGGRELLDELETRHFSIQLDPILDDQTIDLYVKTKTPELEDGLYGL